MKLMNPSRKLFKEKSPTKKGKKEKKLKKKREKYTDAIFNGIGGSYLGPLM
jgi:glucose-6-phosphate isomerase